MCYESWKQDEQAAEALKKARKEAEEVIEKAKSTSRPERQPETQRPVVETEETAA